ncbi:hypothetical protein Trydic_g16412 [Trypoxylus dichotomus]
MELCYEMYQKIVKRLALKANSRDHVPRDSCCLEILLLVCTFILKLSCCVYTGHKSIAVNLDCANYCMRIRNNTYLPPSGTVNEWWYLQTWYWSYLASSGAGGAEF